MQTDRNNIKVQKTLSMHSHAFERQWKRQIVTDTKSRNASHIPLWWLACIIIGRIYTPLLLKRLKPSFSDVPLTPFCQQNQKGFD